MGRILVGLIFAIPMALWVFHAAKNKEKHPAAWAIFALLAWPIPSVIIGYRYRRWVMFSVGCLGVDLLLASVAVLCSVLTTAKQIPVSDLLLFPVYLIPLTILSLVSLVLIAKRCRGRLYGFIHAYVALNYLSWVMSPWVWRYIQSVVTDSVRLGLALTIYNCILLAVQFAILWLGFILGEKEARRRFKRPIILWSIAQIVAIIIPMLTNLLAVHFVNRYKLFESWDSMFRALYFCVNLPLAILPPLILLVGVLKAGLENIKIKNEEKDINMNHDGYPTPNNANELQPSLYRQAAMLLIPPLRPRCDQKGNLYPLVLKVLSGKKKR